MAKRKNEDDFIADDDEDDGIDQQDDDASVSAGDLDGDSDSAEVSDVKPKKTKKAKTEKAPKADKLAKKPKKDVKEKATRPKKAAKAESDAEDVKPTKKAKTEASGEASTSNSAVQVAKNDQNESFIDLGKTKRVTIRPYQGMVLVDIREYYTDKATQDMKPGKKGISLSTEQWDVLKSAFKEVDAEIASLNGKMGNSSQGSRSKSFSPKKQVKSPAIIDDSDA